jgi:hypothetical protein
MSVFSAKDARDQAVGQRAVFDEIAIIEPMILDAVDSGAFEVTVGPGSSTPVATGMTVSATHFNAYTDPANYSSDTYTVAKTQMFRVIRYFTELGYTIRVAKHEDTSTFNWIVKW